MCCQSWELLITHDVPFIAVSAKALGAGIQLGCPDLLTSPLPRPRRSPPRSGTFPLSIASVTLHPLLLWCGGISSPKTWLPFHLTQVPYFGICLTFLASLLFSSTALVPVVITRPGCIPSPWSSRHQIGTQHQLDFGNEEAEADFPEGNGVEASGALWWAE